MAALTETLRLELKGERVRVVEICPGMVHNEGLSLVRYHGDRSQADAVYDASARRTGGSRHVRFRTSADCVLSITSVAVPKADVTANLAALKASGALRAGDVGLAFVGPTLGTVAGDATRPVDARSATTEFA